ncbi:MAG TPA: hypothetical protein VF015_06965 [Acidimicrobiales bacterium]
MTELAVVLEEGFDGDEVAVRVGDEVVFAEEAVTTRPQVGYARRFTVDVPDGDVDVSIELPSRDVTASFPVTVSGDTNVGISLDDDQVTHRTSDEPFWYA